MMTAFWSAATLIVVSYAGMPLLVLVRGLLRQRPVRCDDITPSVSVVIAAHQEAERLPEKLASIAALDYPAERLEVVVASDGSTDDTVAVGRAGGARVLELPRVGKAGALNAAVEASTGEILVFTDANGRLDPAAIRRIVRPFADSAVGGVAGDQRYLPPTGSPDGGVAAGEQRYWDLDRLLKRAESRAGNVIAATGGLYAIRRSLFVPVVDGVTDDFATSTAVIEQGYRLVFCEEAVVWEPVAGTSGAEYGRKVRVMTRGLRAVVLRRRLLDPRRAGFYAVQLLWHKVLRRLTAVPLVVLAACTPGLWRRGPMYRVAAAGQAFVYGLGATGLVLEATGRRRSRLLAVPAFFCLTNAAALHALWNIVRGRRIDRWSAQR